MPKEPIYISSNERTSSVTNGYSICIDHRNDFEDYSFSQFVCDFVFTQEKLNDAMYNPRRVSFSRMNPSCDNNDFLSKIFSSSMIEVGYC